jgi:hypothetical protein
MVKRFRALRFVALIYRILAWIAFIGGALLAVFSVVIGAIQGRVGEQSPLLMLFPVLNLITGVISGLMVGLVILIGAVVVAVLFFAVSEFINLGLAIEENTREAAFYLRGEGSVPPPPSTSSWENPCRSLIDE